MIYPRAVIFSRAAAAGRSTLAKAGCAADVAEFRWHAAPAVTLNRHCSSSNHLSS
jgi:hypothetical protein